MNSGNDEDNLLTEQEENTLEPLVALFKYHSYYTILNKMDNEIEKGEAHVVLNMEKLNISPVENSELEVYYKNIMGITSEEYTIRITLDTSESILLSYLGYYYEDFLKKLLKIYNQTLVKSLLMEEKLIGETAEAVYTHFDENEKLLQKSKCVIQVCETALIVIPPYQPIIRIPYSFIVNMQKEDFQVKLLMDLGDAYILSQMGRKLDTFVKVTFAAAKELNQITQRELQSYLPSVGALTIRQLANRMKDGRAVAADEIDSIKPGLWSQMERAIITQSTRTEYQYLVSLSGEKYIYIGIKKGTVGGLTGNYIWTFIPIIGTKNRDFGNAVAIETINEESKGKATYFFRIMSRKEYASLSDEEVVLKKARQFIKTLNYWMYMINFRREPIYLPDSKANSQYEYALEKLVELMKLRDVFIGRVLHKTKEQWEKDVVDLLQFNTHAGNDKDKWVKEK